MTRAGEAAEGQNGSSIVILILGLEGGFGTLWNILVGVGIAPSLRNILNSLPFKERRWQKNSRAGRQRFHRTAFR